MLEEMYERGLPGYLQHDIEELKKGLKEERCLHLDCLYDELYGSINSAYWDNDISDAQADFLRKKYLLLQ